MNEGAPVQRQPRGGVRGQVACPERCREANGAAREAATFGVHLRRLPRGVGEGVPDTDGGAAAHR